MDAYCKNKLWARSIQLCLCWFPVLCWVISWKETLTCLPKSLEAFLIHPTLRLSLFFLKCIKSLVFPPRQHHQTTGSFYVPELSTLLSLPFYLQHIMWLQKASGNNDTERHLATLLLSLCPFLTNGQYCRLPKLPSAELYKHLQNSTASMRNLLSFEGFLYYVLYLALVVAFFSFLFFIFISTENYKLYNNNRIPCKLIELWKGRTKSFFKPKKYLK